MQLVVTIDPTEPQHSNTTVTIRFYDNILFITPKKVVFGYIFSYKKEKNESN